VVGDTVAKYLHQVFTNNRYSDGIIKEGSKKSPKGKPDITVDNQQENSPVLSITYI